MNELDYLKAVLEDRTKHAVAMALAAITALFSLLCIGGWFVWWTWYCDYNWIRVFWLCCTALNFATIVRSFFYLQGQLK